MTRQGVKTPEKFRRLFLKRAKEVGMLKACREFKVEQSTGYDWRKKALGLPYSTIQNRIRREKKKAQKALELKESAKKKALHDLELKNLEKTIYGY